MQNNYMGSQSYGPTKPNVATVGYENFCLSTTMIFPISPASTSYASPTPEVNSPSTRIISLLKPLKSQSRSMFRTLVCFLALL